MRLPPFELAEPRTLREAVDLLSRAAGDARLVAGGTALVPMMRLGLVRPDLVVSLDRIPGLGEISRDGDDRPAPVGSVAAERPPRGGALAIGAMVTVSQLLRAPAVRQGWPLLAEAAGAVATPGIRSAATLGGSLGYGEAASDLAPALLCLDALVHVAGPSAARTVPLAGFYTGFYATVLEPGEIVARVSVPPPPAAARSGYVKFCSRSREDKPLVGVAAVLALDARGRVADLRVGLAGVAPTPIRASGAEALLRAELLGDAAIRAAAERAAAEADPLSDGMGTADYRRRMIRVWVRRLLTALRDGTPVPAH